MSEAKSNLSHIYTLEKSFHKDNHRYGGSKLKSAKSGVGPLIIFTDNEKSCKSNNEIDFGIETCLKTRYEYSIKSVSSDSFVAVAQERVIDGKRRVFADCNAPLDTWQIDEQKALKNLTDVSACVLIGPSERFKFIGFLLGFLTFMAVIDVGTSVMLGGGRAAIGAGLGLSLNTVPFLIICFFPIAMFHATFALWLLGAGAISLRASEVQRSILPSVWSRPSGISPGIRTGILVLAPALFVGIFWIIFFARLSLGKGA